MKRFNRKYIAIAIITLIFLGISYLAYGELRNKVLNKEYMKNIYVDSDTEKDDSETSAKEITTSKKVIVEIKGEVNNPDVYELEEGAIIKDLIDIAGGLTSKAYIMDINRAKKLENHELIIINSIDNINNENLAERNNSQSASGLININTADVKQLQELSGIGESKAQKIVDYREKNGRFASKEDLKNVGGIGEKLFEDIKDKISF